MTSSYGLNFHASRDQRTRYAADRILGLVLGLSGAQSICDVGCGVGTWLRVAHDRGVADLAGIEGQWLNRSMLVIDSSLVETRDLERPLETVRRFDLAICIEVAEHLSPDRAIGLVQDLARISDTVLFSAAIPDQTGVGHRNERWQSYWASLFAKHEYGVFDVVRPAIWSDEGIPFWYRQNTLVYARLSSEAGSTFSLTRPASTDMLDVVHPHLYLRKVEPGPRTAARLLLRAAQRMLRPRRRPSARSDT